MPRDFSRKDALLLVKPFLKSQSPSLRLQVALDLVYRRCSQIPGRPGLSQFNLALLVRAPRQVM